MDYFKTEDLELFYEKAGNKYVMDTDQQVGIHIRETIFKKVSFWGIQVANKLNYSFDKRNNWLTPYLAVFSDYAWCRIYPNPEYKQLFFNVELNSNVQKIVIKIDCKFSGTNALEEAFVNLFREFIKEKTYQGKPVKYYMMDVEQFQSFDELIQFSEHFIQDNMYLFNQAFDLLNGNLIEELEVLNINADGIDNFDLVEAQSEFQSKPTINTNYPNLPEIDYTSNVSETLAYYINKNIQNSEIGKIGENLVEIYETKKINRLISEGKLSDDCTVVKQQDKTGFDFLSYDENGNEIHIEVKTTLGNKSVPFYMSDNEVKIMKNDPQWILYRIHSIDRINKNASFFKWKYANPKTKIDLSPKSYLCELIEFSGKN